MIRENSLRIRYFFFINILKVEDNEHDIDGAPLSGEDNEDEDVDGVPLDGAALLKGALLRGIPEAKPISRGSPRSLPEDSRDNTDDEDDDIDGIPCKFIFKNI